MIRNMLSTRNQTTMNPVQRQTKTVILIPSLITWGIVALVVLMLGLGLMFLFFPTFTFFLKYCMIAVAGLIAFGISYNILCGFVHEYIATAVISLIIAIAFTIVMRMFPFYWLVAITIVIGIIWIILKTSGITRIFERNGE